MSQFQFHYFGIHTSLGVVRPRPPFLPSPLLDEAHVLQVVGELGVPPDVPHEADVVPLRVAQGLKVVRSVNMR